MAFRRLMGVKMPYEQQVLVYAICRMVTGDRTVKSVAMEHYMSATVLYACRRKLYERWFEK